MFYEEEKIGLGLFVEYYPRIKYSRTLGVSQTVAIQSSGTRSSNFSEAKNGKSPVSGG